MQTLTVIVPCYNEEAVVETAHERIGAALDGMDAVEGRMLFVDDGSEDSTLQLLEAIAARDPRVSVIAFSRNFGHEAATSAGLRECDTDLAVILDADLQDPPELIPAMLDKYNQEICNVIYGVRRSRKGEGWLKRATSKLFYRLLQKLSDVDIPPDVGDFRLIDRLVLDAFRQFDERARFVRGIMAYAGFVQLPLEFDREPRAAGKTKYSFRRLFTLAMDVLLSHSTKPLRVATHLGFWSILVGLVLAVYAVLGHFLAPEPGWASTIITVVFFGGVQLFTIGVVGQYLATVLVETKARPIYIVRKRINI